MKYEEIPLHPKQKELDLLRACRKVLKERMNILSEKKYDITDDEEMEKLLYKIANVTEKISNLEVEISRLEKGN